MDTPENQDPNYEQMNMAAALVVESLGKYYEPLIQSGRSIPVADEDIANSIKTGLERDVEALKQEFGPQSVGDQLDSFELSGISSDELYQISIAVKEELIKILESDGLDGFLKFTE